VRTRPTPWLALGLALLVASTAARVVEQSGPSIEPSRTKRAHLSAEQRERLTALLDGDTHASIEYWVSPKRALPHDLRGLEATVRAAFGALDSAHPERLQTSVHHPDSTTDLAPHLSALGVRATRAPRVEDDRWSESELTSSLRFTLGPHAAHVRNGLLPSQTDNLPELLIAHLEDLVTPSRPQVLLDAPQGFEALATLLADRADLRRADLETDAAPLTDDLIVWIQPEDASQAALARVETHLRAGGDLLLAGSATGSALGRSEGEVMIQLQETPAFARALSALGVSAHEGVLLDPLSDALPLPDGTSIPAPQLVSVPAVNQDFRALDGQPNGSLLFDSPTAFQLDPGVLAARGLRAEILATASPRAVRAPLPADALRVVDLVDLEGAPAPRDPLAALLTHRDPARGRVLLLGSASPLADAHLSDERYRHLVLTRVLLDTLVSKDRHLLRRTTTHKRSPLPPLDTAARTRARLLLILSVPALLTALFLSRRERSRGARLTPRLAPAVCLIAAPVVFSLALAPLAPWGLDTTAERRHHLDDESAEVFRSAVAELGGDVSLELWRPERAALPVELAHALDRAEETLSGLCRASGIDLRERSGTAREAAQALGLEPRALAESLTEARRVLEVCVGARIEAYDEAGATLAGVTLDLSDVATHERLRFRLALALRSLGTGAPVELAVASDRPLLSPAEAVLEYQNQGHFAPGGADPYGPAKAWLEAHGFSVTPVDPKAPKVPATADALLVFQPRRDAAPIHSALFERLSAGGRVLLAAQTHDLLGRRLSESDHAFAWWPRPLYPDVEGAFQALGLSLDPRLLFDELQATALIPTRVDRPGLPPKTELRAASAPFCVKVLGSSGHGDLTLVGANSLAVDAPRIEERGLKLTPWLRASSGAWAHAWEGGDLTETALAGASTDELSAAHPAALLAADLAGSFPGARVDEEGALELTPANAGAEGQLSLIGSSAPFRAAHLHQEGSDNAQLLLLAASKLTLEPALTELLTQREAPVGFEPLPPNERLLWRLFLLGGAPLLLAGVGLRRVRRAS